MLPSGSVSSISTNRGALALQATAASLRAGVRERLNYAGISGYLTLRVVAPILQLVLAAIIYGARPGLLRYSVVGIAAGTFIFNCLYYVGQQLDEERIKGTLISLFLAPCPRMSWLTGFALAGLVETFLAAISALLFGHLVYGVPFHPDWPALSLSFLLFLASLWGMGLVFSALGLILKRSNDLANLISPFTFLLGGVYYPVALLPDWLRYPARALPLGYGMQAMASAALAHASIAQVASQLIPLAGFAVALPCLGMLAFRSVERLVRQRGELELY